MAEYAKVVDGIVMQVIVAEPDVIGKLSGGPYILTPYNPITGEGKVGPGFTYDAQTGIFTAPADPPEEP